MILLRLEMYFWICNELEHNLFKNVSTVSELFIRDKRRFKRLNMASLIRKGWNRNKLHLQGISPIAKIAIAIPIVIWKKIGDLYRNHGMTITYLFGDLFSDLFT